MVWFVCALLTLTLGFAVVDAALRLRTLRALQSGGFEPELAEIDEATDPVVVQALRNELTVSIEALLAANRGRSGAHARICFAAGGVAVILSVRSEPLVAAGLAAVAAAAFAVTTLLSRACVQSALRARKRWRAILGVDSVRHTASGLARRREFQSG